MKAKMGTMYDKIRSMNRRMGNVVIKVEKEVGETKETVRTLITLKPIKSIDSLKEMYEGEYSDFIRKEYALFNDRLNNNMEPISDHHKEMLEEEINNPRFWWYHDTQDRNSYNKKSPFRVIIKRLLQFGGEAVCIPRLEETYRLEDELLVEFGQLFMCNKNYLTPVADSVIDKDDDFAVDNFIAKLFENMGENTYVVCHGYALCNDSIWRQCDFIYNKETNELIDLSKYHNSICFYGYAFDTVIKPLY